MAKKMELLSLKTLHMMDDGELETSFTEMLAVLAKDVTARPALKKARTLKLELSLEPKLNNDGTCDEVFVEAKISSRAPSRPIRPYLMQPTVNGGLKYQPESPLDPNAAADDGED